jgi:hypothetical protein
MPGRHASRTTRAYGWWWMHSPLGRLIRRSRCHGQGLTCARRHKATAPAPAASRTARPGNQEAGDHPSGQDPVRHCHPSGRSLVRLPECPSPRVPCPAASPASSDGRSWEVRRGRSRPHRLRGRRHCRCVETDRFLGPKPLTKRLRRVRRHSRALSRASRGSRNRATAARRLSREHARIANIRRSFLQEVSSQLAKTRSRLAIEHLAAANLIRNRHLGCAIADAGWAELARQLAYKTVWFGGELVVCNRWFASTRTAKRAVGSSRLWRGRRWLSPRRRRNRPR